jgi:hypothetical protein
LRVEQAKVAMLNATGVAVLVAWYNRLQ